MGFLGKYFYFRNFFRTRSLNHENGDAFGMAHLTCLPNFDLLEEQASWRTNHEQI